MSPSTEDRYRRLLRWYPYGWRRANEDVVLGTMLDVAESEGRIGPSARERGSAVVHGLGVRLGVRTAFVASLIGLTLAAVGGGLSVWGAPALSALGLSWVVSSLTSGAVPCLAAIALIAVAQARAVISPPRAVAVASLSVVALVSSFLAFQAWGLAFDAADEGVPANGLGSAFAPIVLAGWVTGGAAIAVLVDGVLTRAKARRGPALLIATVCGGIGAPLVGMSLITPAGSTIAAAGVAVMALTVLSPRKVVARMPRATVSAPARTLRAARSLAWISLAGSAAGVFYALTGSAWSAGASDGTVAMGQGITLSVLSGLPLLGAFVIVAGSRRPRSVATWGPGALLAASLGATAVAYLHAPSWNEMASGLAVSAAFVGAAIAVWLAPRLPGPAAPKYLTSALLGLGYATFIGMMLAPLFAFVIPLGAVAFAIWGTRQTLGGVDRARAPRAAGA
ncbi:hypothetical protein ACFXP7_05435 [Microbacterium sp. P06]|uniref:hypothetical protein n=1 Tax=Microbacterium sp. P06 TaxID=3366949 RepID=UPI0037452F6E